MAATATATPAAGGGRQIKTKAATPAPVKGKDSFSISSFMGTMGLKTATKSKPLRYLPFLSPVGGMPLHDATGIVGPALGYLTIYEGHSNTGKSTAINATAAACHRGMAVFPDGELRPIGNKVVPVLIDTENNMSWKHLETSGLKIDWQPDPETGELVPTGDFIYVNPYTLYLTIGKARNAKNIKAHGRKKRSVCTIEDVAAFINLMLDKQELGELPVDLFFLWDAIGTLPCDQSAEGDSRNNMWDAAAMNANFQDIFYQRIANSRVDEYPYTNSMAVVIKIRHDATAGGQGTVRRKGGEVTFQAARLDFMFGGQITHGTKLKTASVTMAGVKKDYMWGTQTKVKVVKNHVEGASFMGEVISTDHGFIALSEEQAYKDKYKGYIFEKLQAPEGSAIEFIEELDTTGIDSAEKVD